MKESMYLLFDQYLNNELDTVAKDQFETRVTQDADFATAFNLYQETQAYLQTTNSPDTLAFKANLRAIAQQHSPTVSKKAPRIITLRPWLAMAASVVFAVGIWFLMQHENPNYTDYDQHEMASFTERGGSNILFKNAEKAFNTKDYKKAEGIFRQILSSQKTPEIHFYYAITLIENNQYTDAENELKFLQKGSSIYKDKATWYLALSQLKQNHLEDCKNYLLQIKDDQEDYTKAQELLEKL